MDPSILKGEPASGKKQKVLEREQKYGICTFMSYKKNVHINQPLFWHLTSQIEIGLLVGNSQVIFEKSESSCLTLVGECYHT